jgi:hypothetical protein
VSPRDQKTARWGYVFYEDESVAPAADYLESLPSNVRQRLLDTIDAVLLGKNPPRAYLPNRWHSMKDRGVDMGDYFEARDQHGDTNHRLFCRFDSAAANTDLASPVLVLLTGASKPVRTPMDDKEYRAAHAAWARYNQPRRRCGPISFPPATLPASPRPRP